MLKKAVWLSLLIQAHPFITGNYYSFYSFWYQSNVFEEPTSRKNQNSIMLLEKSQKLENNHNSLKKLFRRQWSLQSLAPYHEKGSLGHLWTIFTTDVRLCLTHQSRLGTPCTYKTRNRKKANNHKPTHKPKQFWACISWLQLSGEQWRSWFFSTDCQDWQC